MTALGFARTSEASEWATKTDEHSQKTSAALRLTKMLPLKPHKEEEEKKKNLSGRTNLSISTQVQPNVSRYSKVLTARLG